MNKGWVGWAGVAVAVAGWEVPAIKFGLGTMTACNPWITVPVMAYLTAHLAGLIPPQYDPLELLGAVLSPNREMVNGC